MSKRHLKRIGYPSPGGKQLSAKDLDRLTAAASEQVSVGGGLSVQHGTGSATISRSSDLRIRHFQLMTQQQIDSSTGIPDLPSITDWKTEGMIKRMDYSSSASTGVEDDVLSAWCSPYAHEVVYNTYKPISGHPHLIYFPHVPVEDSSEHVAGDKITAFWNADSGRWEAFKSGGGSESNVKCVITTDTYIEDACVYPGQIRGARVDPDADGCKIEEFAESIWIYFDENPQDMSIGFQAFGLKIADEFTIPDQDPPVTNPTRPLYHVCVSSEDNDPIKKIYICEYNPDCCLYWGRSWTLDIGLDGTWCEPKLLVEDVWVMCPSSISLTPGSCDFGTLIYQNYTCNGASMPIYLFGGSCCPDLGCPGVNQDVSYDLEGPVDCSPDSCPSSGKLVYTEDAFGSINDGWAAEWECTGSIPAVMIEVEWRRINDPPDVLEVGWLDIDPLTGEAVALFYDPDGENLVSVDLALVIILGGTGNNRIKLDAQDNVVWNSFTYRYGLLVMCDPATPGSMDGVLYHMMSDDFVDEHGITGDRDIGDPQSVDFEIEACLLSSHGVFDSHFGYDSTSIQVKLPDGTPITGIFYFPFSWHVYGGCKCLDFTQEVFSGTGSINFTSCGEGSIALDWSDEYYLPPIGE